jgi:hypothetical protein
MQCVVDQLALPLDATPPGTCRQRGTSSLQRLFRAHLPELLACCEAEFAFRLVPFRRQRIARIQCANPDCKADYVRPFGCKVFHLCPSCISQETARILARLPTKI